MGEDVIKIHIEEDGKKITSTVQGEISSMNHQSGEDFLRHMERLAGGFVRRTKDKKAMHKHGSHTHGHDHERTKG